MSGNDVGLVCGFRSFVEHEKVSIKPKVRSRTRTAVRITIFGVLYFFFGN